MGNNMDGTGGLYVRRNIAELGAGAILASWKAEIGRILVQGRLEQTVCETLSLKQPEQNGLEVWFK
jgi:hypothetical protein